MTDYGGDPAFGFITPITGVGIDTGSHSIAQQLTDPEGGGVRVSARRLFGLSWFAGAAYTGFFTDESSSIGQTTADTDNVHASLLDRPLVSQALAGFPAGTFDEGVVDFASETIDVEQHFGDLVVGQRGTGGGRLSGFWHAGVRIANTDVDREVIYRNLEGAADLDKAQINFKSEMWGVGPTVGGGLTLSLPQGFALATSASASTLYADFDLSRRDAYFNQNINDTEIRAVSLDTQEIVPVFDASVELKKRIGRFHASLGYTMSAWLDSARSIAVNGWDDVDDDTTPYRVKSDNIITHGIFARVGMKLGAAE